MKKQAKKQLPLNARLRKVGQWLAAVGQQSEALVCFEAAERLRLVEQRVDAVLARLPE